MTAFDQIDGSWPVDHPLPLPAWSSIHKDAIVVDKIWEYEDLVARIEVILQRMLEETHYDTANNFIEFYQSYKKSNFKSLKEFFEDYDIPVNRRHLLCVSLAMEIIHRISLTFPKVADHIYIVSCEENLDSTRLYIENCDDKGIHNVMYSLEKEHAMAVMKVHVNGRDGFLLLDPGYHVGRAVTIMKDQCYPHTGWFTQSEEKHCKREYCYTLSKHSDNFIEWSERQTRSGIEKYQVSLVYVEKPYRTAVDVTIRRNLVYGFRSLLSRTAKGRVCAGIYYALTTNPQDAHMTLFYDGPNNSSIKLKQKISVFREIEKISDSLKAHVEQLATQLNYTNEALLEILFQTANVMFDQGFISQVLDINNHVTELSADN